MVKKHTVLIILILLFFPGYIFSQLINPEELNSKISRLNDQYKYEESIVQLEEIIDDQKSSEFDKYNAYLQKALTYKRLYNYPEVSRNLKIASTYGEKSREIIQRESAEVRILMEELFVAFDTQKFDKIDGFITSLNQKNLKLLNSETQAFYANVLATKSIDEKDFASAERTLNEAIDLLKKEEPKHLPAIFVKLITLNEHLSNKEKAVEAYAQGMYYADKYNMDIYKKLLHYTMSHFFAETKDYKEAYNFQSKGVELTFKYNANYYNGNLTVLDKDLLDQRKNKELDTEKKIRLVLILLSILLIAFIFVLFKLYRFNEQRRLFIERENGRMRLELENQVKELDDKEIKQLHFENSNLSSRQIDIINLVKEGKTNKEIGAELFISENTVKYHLKIVYNVLGIENRWDLKK